MTTYVYVVYDAKVETFNAPFHMKTKGEAWRGFADAVNDPKTTLHRHPQDFSLYELGSYDDNTGRFSNHDMPRLIVQATEVLQENKGA